MLGLQLSATQWGTAIAAEARPKSGPVYRSGQRTLRDADEIARDILALARQPCTSARRQKWTCPPLGPGGGHLALMSIAAGQGRACPVTCGWP